VKNASPSPGSTSNRLAARRRFMGGGTDSVLARRSGIGDMGSPFLLGSRSPYRSLSHRSAGGWASRSPSPTFVWLSLAGHVGAKPG
jgi:hypothetical protein